MSTNKIIAVFLSVFIIASHLPAARIHDEAKQGHWEAVKEILLSYGDNAERQRVVDSRDGNSNLLDIITGSGIKGASEMADWILNLLLGNINVEANNSLFRTPQIEKVARKVNQPPEKMHSRAEILQPIREKILKQRQRAQDFLQKTSSEGKKNLREYAIKDYRSAKEDAIRHSQPLPNAYIKNVYYDDLEKKTDYTIVCYEEVDDIRVFIYFHPHVEYGGEGIVYSAIELKKKTRKENNDETFLILKEKRKLSKDFEKSEKKYPDELAILKHLYLDKGHVIFKKTDFLFMEDTGVPINKIPAELTHEICLEILKRMEELHKRQFLHLDFKHRNVLIYTGLDGLIKISLCDFGSACHMDDANHHEIKDCTPIFTPPESAPPTTRTDMFQVGKLLAMLLTNFDPEDFNFAVDREAAFLSAQAKLFREADEPMSEGADPVRLHLIRTVKRLCSAIEHRPGKHEMTGIIRDLEELMLGKSFEADNIATIKKSSTGKILTLPLDKLKKRRSSGAFSSGSSSPGSGASSPSKKNITPPSSSPSKVLMEVEYKPRRTASNPTS